MPSDIGISPSGHLYVADNRNYRVQKMTTDCNYVLQWGGLGTGDGQFYDGGYGSDGPVGVDFDASGNVFVLDYNDSIQKFDANGIFAAVFTAGARDIACHRGTGNVYVLGGSNVICFSNNLVLTSFWGTYGNTNDRLYEPKSIVVDSVNSWIYVADVGIARIKKFDMDGNFLASFGGSVDPEQEYDVPYHIALDPSGNVYLCSLNGLVEKYAADGTALWNWEFAWPSGIAFDTVGNMYVSEMMNCRVLAFPASTGGYPAPTPTITPIPTPGKNWTLVNDKCAFQGRMGHASVVFNGAFWVIGGENTSSYNDAWSSLDGVTWNQVVVSAAFTPRWGHACAVFNDGSGDKMWLSGGMRSPGGSGNDVYYSADGANWIQATASAAFPTRWNHVMLAFQNKLWVIGGFGGLKDVWSSPDGVIWTLQKSDLTTNGTTYPTGTVFNGQMWLFSSSEVWSTPDGVNWTLATDTPAFGTNRYGYTAHTWDNRLWVIGGYNNSVLSRGVYSSIDGATWIYEGNVGSIGRWRHTSLGFGANMWVIGGDNGGALNDVLRSP